MKLRHAMTALIASSFVLLGSGLAGDLPSAGSTIDEANAASARPAATAASARRASRTKARRARLRWSAPMEFGIYPGGGAGAVNGRGEPRPEVPELRQRALDTLRKPGSPFVVHLYDAYTGAGDVARTPSWLADQIAGYTAAGMRVELVLRYRPANAAGDVQGFTRFVRSRVSELGTNAGVTSLQITNEANVSGAPDAADGAYAKAQQALVSGVVAAKRQAEATGATQLAIGFNWADETGPRAVAFFRGLRRLGGSSFTRSVDWVGVDAYPGTWGPELGSGSLSSAVGAATRRTLSTLRGTLLPAAGLARTPMVIAESGYPTDAADRTEAQQGEAMRAAVETVMATREQFGVVGYRWFDLRDADSAVPSFESQYGLMRDDYSPKAAFGLYRDLVARHG